AFSSELQNPQHLSHISQLRNFVRRTMCPPTDAAKGPMQGKYDALFRQCLLFGGRRDVAQRRAVQRGPDLIRRRLERPKRPVPAEPGVFISGPAISGPISP